jgi:hypothetical protein
MSCTDSPIFTACQGAFETVHHYILICPTYKNHRYTLTQKLGYEVQSLTTLLSHSKAIKPLFHYITKTQCFKDMHGNLKVPEKPSPSE